MCCRFGRLADRLFGLQGRIHVREFEHILGYSAMNKIHTAFCTPYSVLKKALETQTKDQIIANLTMVCNKLPDNIKQQCIDNIVTPASVLIDEMVKNTSDTPQQACQNVQRCAAGSVLEQLVEQITTKPADNKLDCLFCSIEAT